MAQDRNHRSRTYAVHRERTKEEVYAGATMMLGYLVLMALALAVVLQAFS
jgi:hypothetical protein